MKILEIFTEKLRYKNYSPLTINVYKSYLSNFIKFNNIKDPYQVTTNQIVKFLESYKFTSISQQNQYIGCLKLFAKHILNKKDIHLSKIERPKPEKKLPQVIDKDFLLDRISKIENKKHKAIIALAFSTGLRVSEVVNLKIEHFDLDRNLINILNAKGRKDRIVPLSQNVRLILREYWKEYKPKVFLFNGQGSEQYSAKSCNQIVKKYLGEKYHFHTLRHNSFTALLESGTDLKLIQTIAGHSSTKTTEIYTHVSNQLLSKVNLPI
jgi:integrase/recombinase XerD